MNALGLAARRMRDKGRATFVVVYCYRSDLAPTLDAAFRTRGCSCPTFATRLRHLRQDELVFMTSSGRPMFQLEASTHEPICLYG